MNDMIEDPSALHNWKQWHGILRDAPSSRAAEQAHLRIELETLLAAEIDKENHRAVAASARMNSLDLIVTLRRKVGAAGIGGLKAAIQALEDHGTATCLQYLYSL